MGCLRQAKTLAETQVMAASEARATKAREEAKLVAAAQEKRMVEAYRYAEPNGPAPLAGLTGPAFAVAGPSR